MNDTLRPPLSPNDPRPDNRPFYIEPNCECGTALVLDDIWEFRQEYSGETSEPWYDEWICPRCRDGIFLDWPQGERDALVEMAKDAQVEIAMGDVTSKTKSVKQSLWPEPTQEERTEFLAEHDREQQAYVAWLARRWRKPE